MTTLVKAQGLRDKCDKRGLFQKTYKTYKLGFQEIEGANDQVYIY